jgi:hypothetical protein
MCNGRRRRLERKLRGCSGATAQDYVIQFADPADNGAKLRAVLSIGT